MVKAIFLLFLKQSIYDTLDLVIAMTKSPGIGIP